jgi:flagellar basal body rod protein FlgC
MSAATRRLEAVASNVANVSTESYEPVRAVDRERGSAAGGGVESRLELAQPREPGLEDVTPRGVDLAGEMVQRSLARNAFSANAASFRSADEMTREAISLKA